VIVRTMGRPELERALDAIASQSHRPVEIVLVDAADQGLKKTAHRGVPVRLVRRGPLARAQAANAGLDAARGAWLLFLDEDDEIDRTHVEQLLAAARRSNAAVAYSQTKLLDGEGNFERLLGGPYSREFLLRSNYLAIHAVLFSRALVAAGHRFDESLEVFEDWDFWLQLSERTPFAFTGFPTAIYRAASGQSGAGSGPNLDRASALAHRDKLMKKWNK
jgi:hypothetical protein